MIDPLIALVQPPQSPEEIGPDADWRRVEAELGTPLPSDYKQFVETYGSGKIDDFIVVLNPFSAWEHVNLVKAGRLCRGALAELRASYPQDYRHEVFPRAGGLLPFAISDNGNYFCWRTMGAPDEWEVVVYEGRGPAFRVFHGGMAECLVALLTGAVRLDVLPGDFPSDAPGFQKFSLRKPPGTL